MCVQIKVWFLSRSTVSVKCISRAPRPRFAKDYHSPFLNSPVTVDDLPASLQLGVRFENVQRVGGREKVLDSPPVLGLVPTGHVQIHSFAHGVRCSSSVSIIYKYVLYFIYRTKCAPHVSACSRFRIKNRAHSVWRPRKNWSTVRIVFSRRPNNYIKFRSIIK